MRNAIIILLLLASTTLAQSTATRLPDRPVFPFATVDDLSGESAKRLRDGDIVRTSGYTTAGDGGGDVLVYHSTGRSGITADSGWYHNGPRTDDYFASLDAGKVADARKFGATGDGSTDDTARLVAWADAVCDHYVLPKGTYKIDNDSLVFDQAGATIECYGTLSCPNGWYSKDVITIDADDITLHGGTILETSADPGASSSGVGIRVQADDVTLEGCEVSGFSYPFKHGGDGTDYTNVAYRDCIARDGYSMGFHITSGTNASYSQCVAHDNGLDGFKAAGTTTPSQSCDGLTYSQCVSYANGQRDIAAGGSEDTNGNGWDLYHGGYRFTLTACVGRDNYGSGFNIKDPADIDQLMGEGFLVGCTFTGAKTLNNGNDSHGVEICATNNGTGGSLIHVIGCNCSENTGYGVSIGGGTGHRVIGGNVNENDTGGIKLTHDVYHAVVRDVVLAGNTGIAMQVGNTNDGSNYKTRALLSGLTIFGNYDATTNPLTDPKTWTTTVNTTSSIRTYSDVSDVTIRDCTAIKNTANNGLFYIGSPNTLIENCYVYGGDRAGIGVWAGATNVVVRDTTVEEIDFSTYTDYGAFYVNSSQGEFYDCRVVQSSSIANSKAFHMHTSALDGCVVKDCDATNVPVFLTGTANVHAVTAAAPTLETDLPTALDSSSNAIAATLGDGDYIGQHVSVVMTDATNASTVTVTNHETSDPEVFTFDAVDEYALLVWTGTEWATVSATATP